MGLSRRELDDLKPEISRIVEKVLGFPESTLVTAALNCIDKGYERNKAERKLSSILEGAQLSKFCSKLYSMYEDYRIQTKQDRKKRKDGYHQGGDAEPDIKKAKNDSGQNDIPAGNPSPGQLTADKIKEIMASAQKNIQERKAQLNLPPTPPSLTAEQKQLMEKQRKMAELQASIAARMARSTLPNLSAGISPGSAPVPLISAQLQAVQKAAQLSKPSPLILDEQGRTIDATTGEAVQLSHHTPTLKANIRAKKREQFKAQLHERPPEEISESHFFDTRMGMRAATRQVRHFKFHEKGKFEQLASRLRTQARLERLQSEIAHTSKRTGIASAAKLATISTRTDLRHDSAPSMEWWDSIILLADDYNAGIQERLITHLIEHPIQMKPPAEPDQKIAIPVMLTQKERKKLRRQNRQEAQKETQEKIRLGLMPPPEPKVRVANLMRVLGTEAVQDPTKVEAHVRAQMAKRLRDHEERNASRKLTKDQKRDKKLKKIQEDVSFGVQVSIFRILNLGNPAKKFKVETNANQLHMTGIVVLHKDCNVVVVEGGPKQQKKFRRLMLHRIKWSEDAAKYTKGSAKVEDSDEEGEEQKMNACSLVWEGMVKNRSFGDIRFKLCPTESFAREQFKKLGVEHYWDLAYSNAVLDGADDDDL